MHDGTAFGLPDEQADHIMNPHLEIAEGWTLMGSDGDAAAGRYNGFALTIGGDATDSETARGWFEALAKDGRVVLPMGKQQWAMSTARPRTSSAFSGPSTSQAHSSCRT